MRTFIEVAFALIACSLAMVACFEIVWFIQLIRDAPW